MLGFAHNINNCNERKSIRFSGLQRAFGRCEKAAVSGEVHPGAVVPKGTNTRVGPTRYAGYSIKSALPDSVQNGSGTAALRLPK